MNATDKQLKNNIDEFKGDEAKLDPLALKSFANSKKVYIQGSSSNINVPFREITISDTPSQFGAEKMHPFLFMIHRAPTLTQITALIFVMVCLSCAKIGLMQEMTH